MSAPPTANPAAKVRTEQINVPHVRGPYDTDVGVFRVMGELFGWKNSRTQEVIQMESRTVESISWMRVNQKEFGLVFHTVDHGKVFFVGFKETDFENIHSYFKKHWKKIVSHDTKLGVKGWHWGQYAVTPNQFQFDVDGKVAYTIPFKKLAGVRTNKADLSLELKQSQTSQNSSEDFVSEIRFCVPPPIEGDAADTAELIKTTLLDASGLGSGDASAIISALDYKQCLMPPGRFDVMFMVSCIKLHGKSSDFRIAFDNIRSVYMLPAPQASHSNWLITLINPLKKGMTKYPAVVVQLEDKAETEVAVNAGPELMAELRKRIPDIKHDYVALENIWASQLTIALTGHKILGDTTFRGATGFPCFRCSHKITSGLFYPLAKEFIFIPKPVITVRFEDVMSVNLGRTQGQQTRLFEFSLSLRSGTEIEFSSVDRQELQPLTDFVTEKGLKIKQMVTESREDMHEDEEDEEEEEAGLDDEESDADFDEEEAE